MNVFLHMDSRKNLWISHSAINNFNNCARLYYFASIYRNPKTGNRVQIVNPYLSLGSAVHEAIDEVIDLSPSKRINSSLVKHFGKIWKNYEGKKGGFFSKKQEDEFRKRGLKMIKKVEGSEMLSKRSLKKEKDLPRMSLSEGVDLVGSFDWIEVLPDESLHIIDFKTGKSQESNKSLQLPIYQILAKNNYGKKVKKLSYWYLEKDYEPKVKQMKSIDDALIEIKHKAEEIKKSIEKSNFSCSSGYPRCFWCRKYESIVSGKAELIGTDEKMQKDLYYLTNGEEVIKKINDDSFLDREEKEVFQIRMNSGNMKDARGSLKKTEKQMEKTISNIKKKIKDNLSSKELKIFVEELSKKENRLEL